MENHEHNRMSDDGCPHETPDQTVKELRELLCAVPAAAGVVATSGFIQEIRVNPRPNFCSNCGTKIGSDWNYCGGCGRAIAVAPQSWPTIVPYPISPNTTAPSPLPNTTVTFPNTGGERCAFEGLPPGVYNLVCFCRKCSPQC